MVESVLEKHEIFGVFSCIFLRRDFCVFLLMDLCSVYRLWDGFWLYFRYFFDGFNVRASTSKNSDFWCPYNRFTCFCTSEKHDLISLVRKRKESTSGRPGSLDMYVYIYIYIIYRNRFSAIVFFHVGDVYVAWRRLYSIFRHVSHHIWSRNDRAQSNRGNGARR